MATIPHVVDDDRANAFVASFDASHLSHATANNGAEQQQQLEATELDSTSPRVVSQPARLVNVSLKEHQLASLCRCAQLEAGEPPLLTSCRRNNNDRDDADDDPPSLLTTRLGVLGDKVGSGKSFVILALMLSPTSTPRNKPVHASLALDHVQVTRFWQQHPWDDRSEYASQSGRRRPPPSDVHTSLLVIPHNLYIQWQECLRRHARPDVRYALIGRTAHLTTLIDSHVPDHDLIVVTSTFYNDVVNIVNLRRLRLRRVIYDEVDSMKLPRCQEVFSRFTWFVTASYENLLPPLSTSTAYGCSYGPQHHHRPAHWITGYIRDLVTELNTSMTPQEMRCLVVKNRDDFVDRCLVLPDVLPRVVKCKASYAVSVLDGNVDEALLERLNAGDVEGAMQCVNPSNLLPQDNVVDAMVSAYIQRADRLDAKIKRLREKRTSRRQARTAAASAGGNGVSDGSGSGSGSGSSGTTPCVAAAGTETEQTSQTQAAATSLAKEAKWSEERNKLLCRVTCIRERIVRSDVCAICFDDVRHKTVTPCCSHAYCFPCVNKWAALNKTCPTCKTYLDVSKMLVIDENTASANADGAQHCDEATASDASAASTPLPTGVHERNPKLQNFKLIASDLHARGHKTLVFSNYDASLDKLHDTLEEAGVPHDFIKGPVNRIRRVLRDYLYGDRLNVLLVNAAAYGSGLNLQATTDVIMFHKIDDHSERQVVGRAQRPGRTCPLTVWYLLHANELRAPADANSSSGNAAAAAADAAPQQA